MGRLLILLALALGLIARAPPASAYPLGQRAAVLTPGACANLTLKADFAAGVYCLNGTRYSRVLDMPGANFGRASAETCQWLDGHLTYASIGQPCITDLGFGAWESRTNLLLQSQAPALPPWGTASGTTLNNTGIAPDGTITASTHTESLTNAQHGYFQSNQVTVTAGATVTLSGYFAAGTRRYVVFGIDNGPAINEFYVVIDTQTWTIANFTKGTGSITSSSIVTAANGFHRVVVVGALGGQTAYSAVVTASDISGPGSLAYAFTGTGATMIAWGFQVEVASFPTPYIPTTSAAMTRAVDALQMGGLAGILNKPFIVRASGISFSAQGKPSSVLVSISDGSTANFASLDTEDQFLRRGALVKAGGAQILNELPSYTPPAVTRGAVRVDASTGYKGAFNGVLTSGATGSFPTALRAMTIGSADWSVGGSPYNGYLSQVSILPTADDITLQRLTQ